jgi:tripartite-type tricarboxylate transporter receptor subunit TctC
VASGKTARKPRQYRVIRAKWLVNQWLGGKEENMKQIISVIAFCLVVTSVGFTADAFAQAYPARPVRLISPFPPPGIPDTLARIVAPKLSEMWGQPVTVENRTGGGGSVGAEAVAKSPADGHTLLVNGSAHVVNAALRAKLEYDPIKDFSPIAPLGRVAYVLVVGKPAGVTTVKELIAAATAKPGELKFTSTGIGSGTHLMAEKFNLDAGIKAVHVPSGGAAEADKAVIAGGSTYWFSPISGSVAHIRDGNLLPLGLSGAKRSNALPNVPTVAEAGVPGFDFTLWFGMWAPAGTPPAVVDKIAKDLARALTASDVQDQLAKLGNEPMSMTSEEFARFVRSEMESVARIVKAAGITPQ